MRKKVFGDQHVSVANTLYSMGLVYKNIGQRRKSVQNFQESLKLVKGSDSGQDLIQMIQKEINQRRRFSIF